jgi:signal transduction histidine kinase
MTSKPKLLIIEDEPQTRKLLGTYFKADYAVQSAPNGESALALLARESFDLLLLDIRLPDIDGYAVLAAVRARFNSSELPVILLSGNDEVDWIIRGLNEGANDYIVKPILPEMLRARAENLIALKRLNDTHKDAIDKLTSSQKAQTQFLSIVSHDLKNPLHNLRTALFLLRDMLPDDPQALKILDNADTTVNDMIAMIMLFLDASRLQAGVGIAVNLSVVNLSDVIRHLAGLNRLAAAEKAITLMLQEISGLVMADGRLLAQAVGNLIDNAIKFSPRGSQIEIGVTPSPDAGDCLRVAVRDHGAGIPPDERARLFGMFNKLSPRPTNNESSTGLGLWIVKQLTLLQGGRVGADFPTGGGSLFWIDMPAFRP